MIFGANARAGVINTTQETDPETFEFKENTFEFGARIGAILPLDGPHVSAVATAGYFNETSSFDDGEENYSGLRINANLRSYFACPWKDLFHSGPGVDYSEGKYDPGSILLSGRNRFNWDIGSLNSTFEIAGEEYETESSQSSIDLRVNAAYYLSEGLAGTVGLTYDRDGDSDDDFSQSNSKWGIRLGGQYHLPDNLKNIYINGKVGFGAEGYSYEYNDESDSDSDGSFKWAANVGVYHHILPKVAMNLYGGYSNYSIGDPTQLTSKLRVSTGLVTFIGSGSDDE